MATNTVTQTFKLMHLYHLAADPANDTGYTLEQLSQMIEEQGGEHEIEATVTTPAPPAYTVEGDIAAHEARISNNQTYIAELQAKLADLEGEEYTNTETQISDLEKDIEYCRDHIVSLTDPTDS